MLVQIKTSCEMQFKIQVRFYSFSVLRYSLPNRPYSEFFRSAFSRIPAYGVQMQKNMDQKNSEYGHFSRSVKSHFLACVIQRKVMEFFVWRPLKKRLPTKQLYVKPHEKLFHKLIMFKIESKDNVMISINHVLRTMLLSYINQSIDLQSKSVNWFLFKEYVAR